MPTVSKKRWIHEHQMIACLDMVGALCDRQSRSIVAACLYLQRDPIYEDILGDDAQRLSAVASQLLESTTKAQGFQVLRLVVTQRVLLQIMERRDVLVWLARSHPETLSILLNAAAFDSSGIEGLDEVPIPPPLRKLRHKGFTRT